MTNSAVLQNQTLPVNELDIFLQNFHDVRPGATVRMMSGLTSSGLSSYEIVAKSVAESLAPHSIALDLACGDGFLLEKMRTLSPDCVISGIDFSLGELDAARLRLGGSQGLIYGDVRSMPISSGSVDVAFSHMALTLISPIDSVLREVIRVLRPQGRFVAVVPAAPQRQGGVHAFFHCLKAACSEENIAPLRFGNGDIRCSHDWHRVLRVSAPEFESVEVEEIILSEKSSPEDAWERMKYFYDVARLSVNGQIALRDKFLTVQRCTTDGSGFFDFRFPVYVISAKKRRACNLDASNSTDLRTGKFDLSHEQRTRVRTPLSRETTA